MYICPIKNDLLIKTSSMMKKLLVLSILLIVSIWTMGQSGWIKENSNLLATQGVGQISVGMNNTNALWAFAVSSTGAIVDRYTKSTDGGTSWTTGTFDAGTGLSQLFAWNADTCWALFNTGSTQGIYKTVNGGTNWTKKGTAYSSSSFADAFWFFDNHNGVAIGDPNGGYFEIYTTSDGGETWTRVPSANIPAPATGEYGITGDVSGYGSHDVWFGTNAGNIFHSTDKGLHWTSALSAFGSAETIAPEFLDSLNGICYRSYLNMGIETDIDVTTDGGATWTDVPVTGDMYARYFSHIPGSAGTYIGSSAAAGANGISVTYDGGYTWTTISSGYDFDATAWINDSTGWAGSTAAAKTTGGMYIYDSIPLIPAPVAAFTGYPTAIAKRGYVTFTDQSTNSPTSWAWTFAGGTPATSSLQAPPQIQYNNSGSFTVTLVATNSSGSSTKVRTNYIHVGGVGIGDQNAPTVKVYPNPVRDELKIESASNIQEVQIYNISGQIVFDQVITGKNQTINVSTLHSGVYNLKVRTDNGYFDRKIVVQ